MFLQKNKFKLISYIINEDTSVFSIMGENLSVRIRGRG